MSIARRLSVLDEPVLDVQGGFVAFRPWHLFASASEQDLSPRMTAKCHTVDLHEDSPKAGSDPEIGISLRASASRIFLLG
jgi:hypothetical protein